MGKTSWQKVEEIIDEALTRNGENRRTYIEEQCKGNSQLKSWVTELLASIEASEGFLETGSKEQKILKENVIDGLSEDHIPSLVGQQLGAYEITELLGHGGMGSVYLAERTDGTFEHRVAVKIIRSGMDTPSNIARFKQEQNILAGLHHPNIARLYDGGITEEGLPYLVMEYIDGYPIDHYCDKHKLTIAKRLELFKTVCSAVQHAHNNLVIHRDLKPDNILITKDGQVKILDFGIAKLLDSDTRKDSFLQTRAGARMLTLAYAAPEQLAEEKITTSTDSYALGGILYKLLSGHLAFELDKKSRTEIEALIRDEIPTNASHRLEEASRDTQQTIAQNRKLTTNKLQKILAGDLDAILRKALRKDPLERYTSAEQVEEDIERYLEGNPVLAREGNLRYYTKKFIQRNKLPLGTSAVFILLVVAFSTFYTLRITQERNYARMEAEKAEQVTEFLVDLFGRSNPYLEEMEGGTDITVGSILKFGTKKIDEELSSQPAIMAELKTVLGEVYGALSEFEQAETLLKEAIHIRRNSKEATNSELANSIRSLAFLYQNKGNFKEAETLLRESITYYRNSKDGLKTHNAASAIARLGNLHWYNKGDYETADSLLNKALRLRKAVHDSNHAHIAINYNDLATLYHAKGDYNTAEPYYRSSIASYKNLIGEHSNLAIIMANFSALLKEQGKYREAEIFQRESLSMHRKLTGNSSIDVALGLGNLGDILIEQNKLTQAKALLEESLDLLDNIFSKSHTYIARTKLNLGQLYLKKKKFTEAEEIIRETQKEYEQLYPEGHPRKSDPFIELGKLYLAQELPRKAVPYFKKAVKLRKEGYGTNNWRTAQAMSFLGINFFHLEKFEQAEPLLIQSYKILDKKRQNDDKYRIKTLEYIIQLYDQWEKPSKKKKFRELLALH